jgi:hypothetical protein
MRLQIAVIATLLALFISMGAAQGASSIDIGVPTSFSLSTQAQAIDNGSNAVGVSGSVTIVHSGGNTYLSVPTAAADNTSMAYLDDPTNGILYRNHTMYLPIRYGGEWAANLVVATDNMTCSDGKFVGLVTGLELDTANVSPGDRSNASAAATIFLNSLSEAATYHIAIVNNDTVSRAVAAAGAQGQDIGLMVEVTGFRPGDKSSIGNTIIRMKIDGSDPNVVIYRFVSGAEKLDTHTAKNDSSVTAEAMASGPAVYVLAGQGFKSPYPPGPGILDILVFVVILVALMAALFLVIRSLLKQQKTQKKQKKK